jgi:restriction endonuclease S subunit
MGEWKEQNKTLEALAETLFRQWFVEEAEEGWTKVRLSIAEGSTSTYPSLKPSDIEAVEFQLPPKKRMDEFESLAAANWDRISNNYRQIKSLTALRDTLLPKLMSGEVRVEESQVLKLLS